MKQFLYVVKRNKEGMGIIRFNDEFSNSVWGLKFSNIII
ncbi:hypothetical protein THALO_30161 [Tenacibaculum halocynthiae]